MSGTVRVAAAAYEDMLRHARETMPEECCGLLIGRDDEILHAVRARNIAAEPRRRFLVDPADHFAAIRRGRATGLSLVGAYHSHPQGEPRPSETDRAEAMEDDRFVHAIVAPRRDEIAAYLLRTGNFVMLELVRVP